jgi:hypothetical protein
MPEIIPLWVHLTLVVLDIFCIGYGFAYMMSSVNSEPAPGGRALEMVYYVAFAALIVLWAVIHFLPPPLSPYVP